MKIAVCSRAVIENLQLPDVPHVIVSIRSPDGERVANIQTNALTLTVLRLCFYDMDRVIPGYEEKESELFQPEQARQILALLKAYPETQHFIVHCEGGLSRSPGVAAAIAKIVDNNDDYYFKHYSGLNRRVYRMILNEHYGSGLVG
jgi:predicted protein tyrosine phosphatase